LKKFAVGVLVLVFAGVAWLVLEGNGSPPSPPVPPGPGKRSARLEPGPAIPALPARTASRKTEKSPRKEKVPAKRRELVSSVPDASGRKKSWKVLVVEKKTGEPVPRAEVLVLDISTVKDPNKLMQEASLDGFGRIEKLLEEFGLSYRADSKGIAWIPPLRNSRMGALIAARKGNLWGVLEPLPDISPPLEVKVSPAREILVQVKGVQGKPVAGVLVGVGVSRDGRTFFPMRRVTEGPSGMVRFRHAEMLFENLEEKDRGLVALLVPLKKMVLREFDPKAFPKDPLVLTLPPTGRVEVHVRGPKGPVPDGKAIAVLSVALDKKDLDERAGPPLSMWASPREKVEGGKAVFPFVGLGLNLEVKVAKVSSSMMMGGGKPVSVKGPGPVSPGGTAVFHVSLTEEETILAGRVLLPSGKPVAEQNVVWTLETKEEMRSASSSFLLRTDREGRFRITLAEGSFHGKSRSIRFALPPGSPGGPLIRRVDLSRDLPPGVTDLGDIRLEAPPTLAAGKVVDPQGRPISGVEISIFAKRFYGKDGTHSSWAWVTGKGALTDAAGRFKVPGKTSSPELKILAGKNGWFQEKEVLVAPGTTGITVVLRKGGTVKASFLVDPGVPLDRLQIHLETRGPDGKERLFSPRKFGKNEAFWTGIPPGDFDLKIRLPFSPILVAEIGGIPIRAGEETGDPRLRDIDLRGKIQVLDLEIVDEKGKEIHDAQLYWGKKFHRTAWIRRGRPVLLTPEGGRTFWILAPGCKLKKVQAGGRKMRIVLERGYRIRLVYSGEAPLPEGPFSLGVDLGLEKRKDSGIPSFPFMYSPSAYFGKDGTLETRVPLPGIYRVSWLLKVIRKSGWSSRGIPAGSRPSIEVRDVPGVQIFRVSLPAKDLEKAIERAGKRGE